MALEILHVVLTDSCFVGVKIGDRNQISRLIVAKNNRHGEMSTGNNRQMYEFVCNTKSACDECIIQGTLDRV